MRGKERERERKRGTEKREGGRERKGERERGGEVQRRERKRLRDCNRYHLSQHSIQYLVAISEHVHYVSTMIANVRAMAIWEMVNKISNNQVA